jgi:hypothetical protein
MTDSVQKPEEHAPLPPARKGGEPPICPEALLDLVQALGAHTSDNSAHKDFGTALYKQYFEELPKQCCGDETAEVYLREVLAAAASAVRGFSVERTTFKRARARTDRIDELRGKLLEPKFFSSPLEGENVAKIQSLAAKLLPSGGVAALLYFSGALQSHPWWQAAVLLLGVLWVLRGDFLLTALTIGLQVWVFRLSGNGHQEVADIWRDSFPRYKALAVDLLISTERIRERCYPNGTALVPQIKWRDVHPGDVAHFVTSPRTVLRGRSPLDVLSAIVDMHFSLDRSVPARYVRQDQRAELLSGTVAAGHAQGRAPRALEEDPR